MDKLIAENTASNMQKAGYSAMTQIMEESDLQPAPEFVDSVLAEQMEDLNADLAMYGVTMEDYLSRMNQTQEEFDEELRTQSEEMARYYMVYGQIAKDKNIEVNENSLNLLLAEYEKMFGPGVVTVETLNQEYGEDVVNQIALEMEITKYIGEHVNINYMTQKEYDAAHPAETEAAEASAEESTAAADAAAETESAEAEESAESKAE